jgi:hypothetical protein
MASSDGLGWTGVINVSLLQIGLLGWMLPYGLTMQSTFADTDGDGQLLLSTILGLAGRSASRKRRAMFDQKNPVASFKRYGF